MRTGIHPALINNNGNNGNNNSYNYYRRRWRPWVYGSVITRFLSPEGPDWGCQDHFLDAYQLYLALFDILFPV